MAKSAPYQDPVEVRSKIMQLIEYLEDNELVPEELKERTAALYRFYRAVPPKNKIPARNIWFMLSNDFNSLYLKLQKLLFDEIPNAKRLTTAQKRRAHALRIAVECWTEGHYFEPEPAAPWTLKWIEPPAPAPHPTPEEIKEREQIARSIANGTWRRGNTNS